MTQDNKMLLSILQELNLSSPDILSSALISADGLPLATQFAARNCKAVDEDNLGAMSAALLALGKRSTNELCCGVLKQVIVQGDDGYIVLVEAGKDSALLIHAKEDAKLGLILVHARRAVQEIGRFIH